MRIVLLRHGTAEPHGVPGLADADRALVEEGREQSRNAGRALRRLGVVPGAVIASPYVRARETAEVVAGELGVPVALDRALEPGFAARDLPALLGRHPGDPVVLVGHNPDFSEVVRSLSGSRVDLAKGGAACLDGEARGAELRWLARPRMFRLVAGAA